MTTVKADIAMSCPALFSCIICRLGTRRVAGSLTELIKSIDTVQSLVQRAPGRIKGCLS